MTTMIKSSRPSPGGFRGSPSRTVSIAFAWISGPDISSSPVVEVGWTSCSEGAVAPMTTILSLKNPGSVSPRTTVEYETDSIVPGGPA
jgi:hypothetical protein